MHCVVAKGYDLHHDPGMKRQYTAEEWASVWNDRKIEEAWALVPLDPVEVSQAAFVADHDQETSR